MTFKRHSLSLLSLPPPVVMTSEGVVKLCDFGLSIYLPEERPVSRAGTLVRQDPPATTTQPAPPPRRTQSYFTPLRHTLHVTPCFKCGWKRAELCLPGSIRRQ